MVFSSEGSLHVPSLTSEGIQKLHMTPLMDGWSVPEVFGWALQWLQMNPFTASDLADVSIKASLLFPYTQLFLPACLRCGVSLVHHVLSSAVLEVLPSKHPKCLEHL